MKKQIAGLPGYRWPLAYALLIFLSGPLLPGGVAGYPGVDQPAGLVKERLRADPAPDSVVRPEKDGTLRLRADKGQGIGPKIKYMPEWQAYGWFTADDHIAWQVQARKGKYDVYLEWSVSDQEAGKPFVFQAGDQQLTGTVAPSGSWEEFKTVKIGQLHLRSGRQKMVLKPNSRFEKGALLDLREIKLVPVK